MRNFDLENIDCHATLAMIEKRWGFPRRTLRALLGMTENTQSGRSLLAESGADAQSGRSMIEMLGVLAIIGVLSVGGIAGYSKAMQKYKINKAIEQITLIAGNVRTFFKGDYKGVSCSSNADGTCNGACSEIRNYNSVENGCPIIKKAKILPDDMITLGGVSVSGTPYVTQGIKGITNPFGLGFKLGTASKSSAGDNKAFYIMYYLNQGDSEACIELVANDWIAAGVNGISVWDTGPHTGVHTTVPVDVDKAVDMCTKAYKYRIYIQFYFDVNSNCWSETNGNTCS